MNSTLWDLSTFVIPLLLAIILHEIAHGWMAYKLGDNMAKSLGRLTLNPIPHIDPVGSILVPGILFLSGAGVMFGWAKPVPVNFSGLKDPKRDMGMVALAGPLTNFILAVLSLIVAGIFQPYVAYSLLIEWFFDSFRAFFMINLALCAFNLFPILPLDGGRILVSLLPQKWSNEYAKTEHYGFFILMGLLFLLPLIGVDAIRGYMTWMMQGLLSIIHLFIF